MVQKLSHPVLQPPLRAGNYTYSLFETTNPLSFCLPLKLSTWFVGPVRMNELFIRNFNRNFVVSVTTYIWMNVCFSTWNRTLNCNFTLEQNRMTVIHFRLQSITFWKF